VQRAKRIKIKRTETINNKYKKMRENNKLEKERKITNV